LRTRPSALVVSSTPPSMGRVIPWSAAPCYSDQLLRPAAQLAGPVDEVEPRHGQRSICLAMMSFRVYPKGSSRAATSGRGGRGDPHTPSHIGPVLGQIHPLTLTRECMWVANKRCARASTTDDGSSTVEGDVKLLT
jgi:hypothetical protein